VSQYDFKILLKYITTHFYSYKSCTEIYVLLSKKEIIIEVKERREINEKETSIVI